jgi:DNA end-binding protein Ku
VPHAELARGYELPDSTVVVLTEEDLAGLPAPSSRTITLLACVPAAQVNPLYRSRSYYVQADPASAKPYVLLRDALAAVVTLALHAKQTLAAL